MPAVKKLKAVRPIARWDLEPSEFWEAVTRIKAELRYDPGTHACRWPEPNGLVRRTVTGEHFSEATKERLCQLVSQLPWLLPMLERLLVTNREEGLARIDHYRGIFDDACRLIDQGQFVIDERADFETRMQQVDALSRAKLFKSELLLIIVQFDLIRGIERAALKTKTKTQLKAVA